MKTYNTFNTYQAEEITINNVGTVNLTQGVYEIQIRTNTENGLSSMDFISLETDETGQKHYIDIVHKEEKTIEQMLSIAQEAEDKYNDTSDLIGYF